MGRAATSACRTALLLCVQTCIVVVIQVLVIHPNPIRTASAFIPASHYPHSRHRSRHRSRDRDRSNWNSSNEPDHHRSHRVVEFDDVEEVEDDVEDDVIEEEDECWSQRLVSADKLLELLESSQYKEKWDGVVQSRSQVGAEEQLKEDESNAVIVTDDFEIYSSDYNTSNNINANASAFKSQGVDADNVYAMISSVSTSSPSIAFGGTNRRRFRSFSSPPAFVKPSMNHRRNRVGSTALLYANDSSPMHVSVNTSTTMRGLWTMCRPNNFGFVLILHLLGILQVSGSNFLNTIVSSTSTSWPVILALVLSSCASMVINDIHDAISGVDSLNEININVYNKPLVSGIVTQTQARQFLNTLYAAIAAVVIVGVKGIAGKMFFILNAIITSIYTPHLKPVTWLKNAVCAMLVAGIPICSATVALTTQGRSYLNLMRVVPLFSALYLQIFAREMVMDLKDYDGDKAAQIQTVPVKYGRKYASKIALNAVGLMGIVSIFSKLALRNEMSFSGFVVRILLASVGSLSMIKAMNEVRVVEGSDYLKNIAFIDNNIGMMMVLASFF